LSPVIFYQALEELAEPISDTRSNTDKWLRKARLKQCADGKEKKQLNERIEEERERGSLVDGAWQKVAATRRDLLPPGWRKPMYKYSTHPILS